MKIGVTGAPTTGTQELAERLSSELDLPLIAEYGDHILDALNAGGIQDLSQEQQVAFQQGALSERRGKHQENDDFIAHRTVLDAAASYMRIFTRHVPAAECESYLDRCRERAESYDLLVVTHHDRSEPDQRMHARLVFYITDGLIRDWDLPTITVQEHETDDDVLRRVKQGLNYNSSN